MREQSLWRASSAPMFSPATLPDVVDVVVIGGGITGLTAAYLLKQAGKRVAVFERERLGAGDTGNTSAHLTYVTDLRLTKLVDGFGRGVGRLTWRAGAAAIDQIESIVNGGVGCGFQRVPGYLCSPFLDPISDANLDALRADAKHATELGFDSRYEESGPITGKPAIAFADQALFHPLDYLFGLASKIDGDGSIVAEGAEVGSTIDDPLAVIVNGQTIACTDLVIATHEPLVGNRNLAGATLFQTKLYAYSSYVLGAYIDDVIAPGLYSDTADPYYYLRVHDVTDGRYAIFGGCDHKTGQMSDGDPFERLEAAFLRVIPNARIERRWSGQVIESPDQLPYIGAVTDHQYIATAYAGNGLTFGTVAAMMIRDAITGIDNPLAHLFAPTRKASSIETIKRYLTENVDYPAYLLGDWLDRGDDSGVENVPRGNAKVIKLDGKRIAVHRRDDGSVVKVSAVCTHVGCLVRWNSSERTWDCPCHGSRYTPEGLVIGGPAEAPLEPVD